jgi:hypothetical protein
VPAGSRSEMARAGIEPATPRFSVVDSAANAGEARRRPGEVHCKSPYFEESHRSRLTRRARRRVGGVSVRAGNADLGGNPNRREGEILGAIQASLWWFWRQKVRFSRRFASAPRSRLSADARGYPRITPGFRHSWRLVPESAVAPAPSPRGKRRRTLLRGFAGRRYSSPLAVRSSPGSSSGPAS